MPKILLAAALTLLSAVPATAETHRFGAFVITDEHPTVLALSGVIDPGAPLDFRRALQDFPNIEIVGLSSPGGDAVAGLLLALEVHDRGIATNVPAGRGCYSACAYVFLAGTSRQVSGEIGTHAPTVQEMDSSGRVGLDLDMRYVLRQFGVPMVVWDTIFNTPNADLRVFDAIDAEAVGLNR